MKTYTVEDPNNPLVADYLRLDDHLLRQERELPDGDMAVSYTHLTLPTNREV